MMAGQVTHPLRQDALGDLEHELATTRRVLERLPEQHFAWKPHEKSMGLGRLAAHVPEILRWSPRILEGDEFDLGGEMPPREPDPATREELLRRFDRDAAAFKEVLGRADDAALRRPWTLRHGPKVLMTLPRAAVLRTMVLSHLIHHRAQLCVYLRLLNVPVPSVYGPSADEPGF
jgi:uncharacterized damage-inducible protein DinB